MSARLESLFKFLSATPFLPPAGKSSAFIVSLLEILFIDVGDDDDEDDE